MTNQISKIILGSLLFFALGTSLSAQVGHFYLHEGFDPEEDHWVDSVFQTLSADARIGQLFMIRAHSDLGPDHIAKVKSEIEEYKVGGLCFFQGTPEKQVELINQYQTMSSVPLMVAVDAEWGVGMRFKEATINFPRQLMLGAIQDNDLIYQMGREVGHQLTRTGVQVNFAPVVDVNNNAANPVINTRSFGEDRYNVTSKSYQYMKGMQDVHVMACAKHFPGHGDTDVDSHLDLPVIKHDLNRLDSIELYPFRVLSKEGVGSMMIAHLSVPALDDRPNRPTTLSRNTVTDLLRKRLKFQGLTFTDALEMKGVTKYFEAGQVEAEAILAGNDVLCLPEDLGAALKTIKNYVSSGKIQQSQIDESVKRILRAKYRLGLNRFEPIPTENIRADINNAQAKALKRKLIQEALTLVRNQENLLPFQEIGQMKMASLSLGATEETKFQERLASYSEMPQFQLSKKAEAKDYEVMLKQLSSQEVVIVGLHDMSQYASRNFGLEQAQLDFLYELNQKTKVVLTVFGNPYSLKYFDRFEWVMCAYDEDEDTQDLAAQGLFGVFSIRGRLPITASRRSTFNAGHITPKIFRMGFAIPEETGLNSDTLQLIDDIIQEAIDARATPGCVVLVAKDGKVVFEKAYGFQTYNRKQPVKVDDIYDLASVTKVAATTLSMMKLQEEGQVDVNQPINYFLPELDQTNKKGKLIKDIMAHHAGLIGWIPFYEQTITKSKRNPQPLSQYYHAQADGQFTVEVAKNLYLRQDFVDSIWQQVYQSDLRTKTNYRYSDLGFYMLAQVIQRQTGSSIDQFVQDQFYKPMGLHRISYHPLEKYDLQSIAPSEQDNYFRRRLVRGYVHDMGAAMLGGVSGHAGLFSDARDLATLMQMLLQGGYYGGHQYLKAETIHSFAERHPRSTRRGIGFDMLELDPNRSPNLATEASPNTFGHLGFTGTAVWADPDNDIVYVFLSNRTFPHMNNNKLHKMDTRPRVQSVIYRAMAPKKEGQAEENRMQVADDK